MSDQDLNNPKCVNPNAPIIPCIICGGPVHTCEARLEENYYSCPAHPDGCQLTSGDWVCSDGCWDEAARGAERNQDLEQQDYVYYIFQCNHCFIMSGYSSRDPEDAPRCCHGDPMIPLRRVVSRDKKAAAKILGLKL